MTYWIEVHCDVRREGMKPQPMPGGGDGMLEHACHTLRGDNPGAMVQYGNAAPLRAAKAAALRAGWCRRNGRKPVWICPGCQAGGDNIKKLAADLQQFATEGETP